MAGKPDLPAVQNVVVYVSNDNFAQTYAVGQPPPPPPPQNGAYSKKEYQPPGTDGTVGGGGYFINYQPPPSNGLKNYHNGSANNEEAVEEPPPPPQGGYVTVLGADVRCESVRSEAAESSCSSLSSADENLLVVQQTPNDMLLYDSSVSVRSGGGVLLTTVPPPPPPQPAVFVPAGWKRIVNNNAVFYISPSNAALSYPEQVKEYLLSSGTCKCGLECHFNFDNVFNFDPKVIGKPWVFSPDTNPGDLTKLCNHKRKTLEIAALDCKPPDHNIKLRKEYNVKKKRRKIGLPYAGGVSVSQILAHREKLQQQQPQIQQQQQQFVKDAQQQQPQIWPQSNVTSTQMVSSRLQGYPEQPQQQFIRCQDQSGNRVLAGSPMIMSDGTMMVQPPTNPNIPPSNSSPNIHIQQHQVITPNGQLIGVPPNNPTNGTNIVIQNQQQQQQQQHRIFINGQPNEPSGPGRPNIQMIPVSLAGQQRPQYQYNQNPQYPPQYDPSKNIRPFSGQILNGFRPQQKMHWARQPQQIPVPHQQQSPNNVQNVYERVPPLHQPQTVWQEEIKRKKVKLAKMAKNRPYIMEGCSPNHSPCPNIDVRQIPGENGRPVISQTNQPSSSPSFMEDPSGYLAQQTALLNNTINRQTGAFTMQNAAPPNIIAISQGNEVPLPSNVVHQMKMQPQQTHLMARCNQNMKPVPQHIVLNQQQYNHMIQQQQQQQQQQNIADSSAVHEQYNQCHGCLPDSGQFMKHQSRPNSEPGTPSSSGTSEDPVISSTNEGSPDSRPIQGGTVSTSNVSPIDGSQSDPPTPPQMPFTYQNSREAASSSVGFIPSPHQQHKPNVVTTMASGRTVASNTITSVLAGRANTATVSINTPPPSVANPVAPSQAITTKSPLEMVQSVVSSIQVPHSQQQQQQIIKHSPTGLPPGHILVSSGGQLIMASTGNGSGVMPPPPPKLMTNPTPMPPISVSPMITNVTASVTQVIPAVAQQVLGQQTVLVNALPTPFVLQPGVTMTMDGMQNMQIPQLLTGNVIQQQALLSPETKKKTKKRKMPSQTVASMLHIAAQQNSGVMQGFPQQIQMAHSPQGPLMQALTILPGKTGAPPQILMNGQQQQLIANSQPAQQINLLQPVNLINGTAGVVQNFPIQQFIVPNLGSSMVMNADGTATILQDTSNLGMQLQIQNVNGQNVLTPVQNNGIFNSGQNILAAGPAGMVIRAPTSQGKIIQQQQHSPGAQFLSPNGGQFVVNGAQFSGQLSPLVASVSPSQQMTFSTSPQQIRTSQPQQQEYIQCNQMGQTLMVPCSPASSSSNQQNTTYVQQNTTIVQQQTTMVSNNQQLNNFQSASQPAQSHPNVARTTTVNLDQNFIISSNDNKQMQAVVLQRDAPTQNNPNYRQSVSTQTAVNQNAQPVTTNTFCQTSTISAGSPPDTTTLSPLASSPPTADTTTHSGSTDDGLSPAPSTCSDINMQGRHQSMAMVHCISSSEPDSAELNNQPMEHDWRRTQPMCSTPKPDYPEMTFVKKTTPTHVAYAESSTLMSGLQFFTEQMKQEVVSSRNYEKALKRNNMFDDDEDKESKNEFALGDLVWGPSRGFPAWPGKVVRVDEHGTATVKWFGTEKCTTNVHVNNLQTLSEGLDAHHQARNKARTSRKLNGQLEAAIQEAMTELDEPDPETKVPQRPLTTTKKTSGRLRSSQR